MFIQNRVQFDVIIKDFIILNYSEPISQRYLGFKAESILTIENNREKAWRLHKHLIKLRKAANKLLIELEIYTKQYLYLKLISL